MTARRAVVTVVQGVCGLAVYVNGYRVVGEKPWGGGPVVACAVVPGRDMRMALGKRRAKLALDEDRRVRRRTRPRAKGRKVGKRKGPVE